MTCGGGWGAGGTGALHRAGWANVHHKKSLILPQSVRKDRRLFTCDVDEFWGARCALGNLQPPLWAVLPQAMLCESCRSSLGAVLCPTDAMGCWESPQNPSPCGSTNAGKSGLCHTENSCPICKGTTTPSQSCAVPPSPTPDFSLCASISFP